LVCYVCYVNINKFEQNRGEEGERGEIRGKKKRERKWKEDNFVGVISAL
jgi:hypothetical protein